MFDVAAIAGGQRGGQEHVDGRAVADGWWRAACIEAVLANGPGKLSERGAPPRSSSR